MKFLVQWIVVVLKLARIEVKAKLDNYRKRAREDVSIAVRTVCKGECSITGKGMT
jgi:hypothetical protein